VLKSLQVPLPAVSERPVQAAHANSVAVVGQVPPPGAPQAHWEQMRESSNDVNMGLGDGNPAMVHATSPRCARQVVSVTAVGGRHACPVHGVDAEGMQSWLVPFQAGVPGWLAEAAHDPPAGAPMTTSPLVHLPAQPRSRQLLSPANTPLLAHGWTLVHWAFL
jgi:hypothetical protein